VILSIHLPFLSLLLLDIGYPVMLPGNEWIFCYVNQNGYPLAQNGNYRSTLALRKPGSINEECKGRGKPSCFEPTQLLRPNKLCDLLEHKSCYTEYRIRMNSYCSSKVQGRISDFGGIARILYYHCNDNPVFFKFQF